MAEVKSRVLFLDIEWKPAVAYVWRMYDENISPDQLIDEGGLLCFCAHWLGEKKPLFFSEWEHGAAEMAFQAFQLLSEADAVVTYNGDRYDLPKLRGHLLLNGMRDVPPPTSIDLIKTVKKLGFVMNKLAYIGPLLNAGKKFKHEGFQLWRSVLEGDQKAQTRMEKYCVQDVQVLRELYERVKPFIKDHPHLGDAKGACGSCGSNHLQQRGWRRTKVFKVQRLQCQDCGGWSTGQRVKI
jgi:hypothetical protein